jgi:hypothetical protein
MKLDGKESDRDLSPPHLHFISPGNKINAMIIMLNYELGFKIRTSMWYLMAPTKFHTVITGGKRPAFSYPAKFVLKPVQRLQILVKQLTYSQKNYDEIKCNKTNPP